MTLPYRYLPRPGEEISVSQDGDDHCLVTVCGSRGFAATTRVLPDEVPAVAAGIAAAMHEAAGLPAPVILERPEIRAAGSRTVLGTVYAYRSSRGDLSGLSDWEKFLKPGEAREAGAVLAAYADAAEAARNEPGPAEVEELAYILRAVTPGMAYPGEGDYKLAVARGFAEAALKWMRDKRQREGDAS